MTRDECRTRINKILNKAHSELFELAIDVASDDTEFGRFIAAKAGRIDVVHHDLIDALFDAQLEIPTS